VGVASVIGGWATIKKGGGGLSQIFAALGGAARAGHTYRCSSEPHALNVLFRAFRATHFFASRGKK